MHSGSCKIDRKVKFRPVKIPRYSAGDTDEATRQLDLKIYNRHLFKLFTSKPMVDNAAPFMPPMNYISTAKCYIDNNRIATIQRENKDLVCRINAINKTRGEVDCWNIQKFAKSKWTTRIESIEAIMLQNERMYKRLKNTKSIFNTKEILDKWKHTLRRVADMSKYPLVIATTKTVDELVREQPPINGNIIHHGYKPRVYMDFKLEDGTCLGEIIIELFPDFCPKTVKNFLSYCNPNNRPTYRCCRIFNAKVGKFFETGDVTLNNGKGGTSIYGDSFPEEGSILRHCRQGVVSTVRVREKGKINTNSKFTITLKPMEELQNRCTVFGRVTKGNHILCKMNYYFKRAGPPFEPIIIKNCGIVPPTLQEMKAHNKLLAKDKIASNS